MAALKKARPAHCANSDGSPEFGQIEQANDTEVVAALQDASSVDASDNDGYPLDLERLAGDPVDLSENRKPSKDLLAEALTRFCRRIGRPGAPKDRVRALWAAVVAARDLGASDVIENAFIELAQELGLEADLGRHGAEDVRHVVRWGLLGRDPFGK